MNKKIIVIEDNPANLELITYLLRAYNYTVLTASDGDEGVRLANRNKADLIICDIYLPKADGFQVVRELKSDPALRKIPVIAVTAMAMAGDREKLLASGFDGYISKPIMPELFLNQIESYFGKAI